MTFRAVVEINRLTTGKGTALLYSLWAVIRGQEAKKGQPLPESIEIPTAELAEICSCDARSITRELTDLKRRRIIGWEQTKKGNNRITLLFRTWGALQDYEPGPVEEPAPEDPAQETPDEEPKKAATTTRVTHRPVKLAAGQSSKPIKLDCGVSALQFKAGGIDAGFSAVVHSGVLVVSLDQKWEAAKSNVRFTDNKGDTRQHPTRLSDLSPVINHPRAAEIAALFDPFTIRYASASLSSSKFFLESCKAIGDVPHEFLEKAVIERAARELKPYQCPKVCEQIRKEWEKSKHMPEPMPAKKAKKGFAEGVMDEIQDRLRKYGRV